MKAFKIYVCVSLTIIVILLALLVGMLIYAGKKIGSETSNVNSKVNSFNQNVDNINNSLQKINSQLQTENANLSKTPSLVP